MYGRAAQVPEVELRGGITLFRSLPDRVEIVLCREHHDCEATRHDHSSGCADQPWYFIDRLQMWATLLSPDPRSLSDSPCPGSAVRQYPEG